VGVLLSIATAFSFSFMNLAIRKGGRVHPGENAVLATLLVNLVAFAVLLAVASVTGRAREIRPDAALAFASIGVTGLFLGRTLLFAGIHRIGVVRASAIKNAAPVVTLALAIVFLGERSSPVAWAGIVLILSGVAVVFRESLVVARSPAVAAVGRGESSRAAERAKVTGVALALGAAFAYGAANVLSKVGMVMVPDAIQAGFFAAVAALVCYAAWETVNGRLRAIPASLLAPRPWFWLAGVAGTTGQLTFYAALDFIAVGPATVITASEVVLTTALGGLLAQQLEQVTRRIAIPAVLVFLGAALIALGR
jgi:drug/metabolite transporter (DMT)-like permease